MSNLAFLVWHWQPVAPIHTGYSKNLASFTGRSQIGAKDSINLETHSDPTQLEPAFLASSVKGVFRQASAWLVERTARQQGETQYITLDYNEALDKDGETYAKHRLRPAVDRLCPVSYVFGASGFIGRSESSGAQRLRAPVTFLFDEHNDAYHSDAYFGPETLFTWETLWEARAENAGRKRKRLLIEQLSAPEGVNLWIRVDPSDSYRLALLWLTADLISSGAFRFGRFTSRGYGIVRLRPVGFCLASLDQLLAQDELLLTSVAVSSGFDSARLVLNRDPQDIVNEFVANWLKMTKATSL
jgi:CRISPR/Cas system CSM-associated protein Csm3 (group 7 of RAMP superfamily)